MADVPVERFYKPEYEAPWKIRYCIDAMLEHAVMHPIRHRFQLHSENRFSEIKKSRIRIHR